MIVKVVTNNDDPTDLSTGEVLWVSGVRNLQFLGVFVVVREHGPDEPGALVLFDEWTGTLDHGHKFEGTEAAHVWGLGRRNAGAGLMYRLTMNDGSIEHLLFDAAAAYLMTDGGDTIDRLRSEVPVAARKVQPGPVATIAPLTDATSSGASTVTYNGTTWDVVN